MSPKKKGGYSGAYRDSKDRIRPITPRKKSGAKTGVPVRIKNKTSKKPKTGTSEAFEEFKHYIAISPSPQELHLTEKEIAAHPKLSPKEKNLLYQYIRARSGNMPDSKATTKKTAKADAKVESIIDRKRPPDYAELNFYARPDSNQPEMTLYMIGGQWKDHRGRKYTKDEVREKVKKHRRGFGVVEADKIMGPGGVRPQTRRNVRAVGEDVYVSMTASMPSRHQAEKARGIMGPYDTKIFRLSNGRYQVFGNYQQAVKADAILRDSKLDKYSGNLRRKVQTGSTKITAGLKSKPEAKSPIATTRSSPGSFSSWKEMGHNFYTREKGEYASIDGQIEYRFDSGILKANGKRLTARQRALDWTRGFKNKEYPLHDGQVSTTKVSPVKKRADGSYSFTVTSTISKKHPETRSQLVDQYRNSHRRRFNSNAGLSKEKIAGMSERQLRQAIRGNTEMAERSGR